MPGFPLSCHLRCGSQTPRPPHICSSARSRRKVQARAQRDHCHRETAETRDAARPGYIQSRPRIGSTVLPPSRCWEYLPHRASRYRQWAGRRGEISFLPAQSGKVHHSMSGPDSLHCFCNPKPVSSFPAGNQKSSLPHFPLEVTGCF